MFLQPRDPQMALPSIPTELSDPIEGAAVPIVWLGEEGLVVRANRAFRQLVGNPGERVEQRPFAEWVTPSQICDQLLLLLEGGGTLRGAVAELCAAGGLRKRVELQANVFQQHGTRLVQVFVHELPAATNAENEDRRAAERLLSERQQQLELALEAGRLGLWSWDLSTHRIQSTEYQARLHGRSPDQTNVSAQEPMGNIHPDDRHVVENAMRRAVQNEAQDRATYRVLWPDGSTHWLEAIGKVFCDDAGVPGRVMGICADITDRKLAEDALRESQGRLQAILDNTFAVVYLKDLQGRYLLVNRQFLDLFHDAGKDIVGKTDFDVFPIEIAQRFRANDQLVQDTGVPLEFEETAPHADGLHTYISVKFPICDAAGKAYAIGGMATDITERKRASEALEAEGEFLRHTIEEQDQQRQLIAYEVHDGPVQYATAALMHLEALCDQIEPGPLADQLRYIAGIVGRTVAEGRRIMNGIRTPVLDDWGVVAALEQLIAEEERAHVSVELVKGADFGRLTPKIEEALFRIAQEALNNSYKHGHSQRVRIELGRSGELVRLSVRDWGVGFDARKFGKDVHGLKAMSERARIAGGRCRVESELGKGTEVTVELPLISRA